MRNSPIVNRKTYIDFVRQWLPVLLWMALIFGASGDSHSVQHTDSLLARLFEFLHIHATETQLGMIRLMVRKGAHMTEFAVLALLWWRALQNREHAHGWNVRIAAIVLAVCIAYAATDEFHQSFVKDRGPSVTDVLIDTAGASLGLAAVWLVTRFRTRQASEP